MKFQPPCLRFHEIGPYVVYPPPIVYIDMYGACATLDHATLGLPPPAAAPP